jgi:hypothetical protein
MHLGQKTRTWYRALGRSVDELQILMPDVVVLLTGPGYDHHIKEFLGKVSFGETGIRPMRELARVVSSDLPCDSFRTYHPRYLCMRRKLDESCSQVISLLLLH